eukprot:scaffold40.g5151.t1
MDAADSSAALLADPPPAPASAFASLSLADVPPDTLTAIITQHLSHRDLGNLSACSRALRTALADSDGLWAALFRRQFPSTCAELQREPALRTGSWRQEYATYHTLSHQLRCKPDVRSWCSDDSAVSVLALHAPGTARRMVVSAQAAQVELHAALARRPGAAAHSVQLFGHTGRVSCLAVVEPAPGGAGPRRLGVITGSADQTVKLWSVPVAHARAGGGGGAADLWAGEEEEDAGALPLPRLLTPMRTLRGHTESVTCLELVHGGGVTIAATGSKDRTLRLWGLAPFLPSSVGRVRLGMGVLRGHGAPVTCLAAAPLLVDEREAEEEAAAPQAPPIGLLSGSLDCRAKLWDVMASGVNVATARLAGPAHALRPAHSCPRLQPHTAFVAAGSSVQLLDLRLMQPVGAVALPAAAGPAVQCFAQWGETLAVTSVHADRLKLATATPAYGEHPVRVWCPDTGACLAALDSAEPEPAPSATVARDDALLAALAAAAGPAAQAELAAAQAAAVAAAQVEHQQGRGYRREWEGVTALTCHGALLVSGSCEGVVMERDCSRGRRWEEEAGGGSSEERARSGTGRFWA